MSNISLSRNIIEYALDLRARLDEEPENEEIKKQIEGFIDSVATQTTNIIEALRGGEVEESQAIIMSQIANNNLRALEIVQGQRFGSLPDDEWYDRLLF